MDYTCIKQFALFQNIPDPLYKLLTDISYFKSLGENTVVMYENDTVETINFLCSGMLKVYKVDRFGHETFLYLILPGTVISEITDFSPDDVRCFSNIESIEPSVILSMNKDKLLKLCDEYPLLYERLLSAFSTKAKMMQCLVNRELVYDGTAKVAYTLLYETEMFTKMKKREIAYMLNIQPETLSRILKKLERKEIIRLESKRAVILDKKALEETLV